MKRGILFFLTQSAIVLALTITAQAAVIYTLGGANTAGGTSLGTIDTVTGAYSVISATLPNGYTYQSLTHNPTPGGTFYTTANTNSYLYDISVSGSTTSIGNTYHNNVFGLAYRTADNTLYAWDGQADNSATVNQTTGAWTDTGSHKPTSLPSGGHFAILNDVWYATWTGGEFGSITFFSPAFTQLGTNSLYSEMSLVSDGTTLYGITGAHASGGATLYSINTANGALTTIASITGGGGAPQYYFGAEVVPEPSTCALLCIGLGMAVCAWKSPIITISRKTWLIG